MVGEEVMLTVEDFREKGAVGAVRDAVADAGDILIDGVSGLIGWIRGDPPQEDDNEKLEDATKALSNGPSGAAYGISQASPTGGINAVWVMPEEADPQALAQLAAQSGGMVSQQNDPRVPKNIQPYQPPPGSKHQPQMLPSMPQMPLSVPGGPMIAPYQPAPSGPGARPPPFIPGGPPLPGMAGMAGVPPGRWGPGGYNPAMPGGSSAASGTSGAKGLVDRIAKGDMLVGAEVVKRLVSQCSATKTSPKHLGEIVSERCRRLYLGLDGGDPVEADASLARLLALADALLEQDSDFSKATVEEIKKSVHEELLSLRSNAKHKAAAEPMLQRLGLLPGGRQAQAMPDLLDGGSASRAPEADLLGGPVSSPVREVNLLGGDLEQAPSTSADLLGGDLTGSAAAWDPMVTSTPAPASGLLGLNLDPIPAAAPAGSFGVQPGTMGAGAILAETKKDEDAFGFVGAELSKATR